MPTDAHYAFDNRADEAVDQLRVLESALDPITASHLERLGVPAGAHCWEVGAGAGSVARLLARLVGPEGSVTATDLDPTRLTGSTESAGSAGEAGPAAEVRVLRHDVRHEPPPGGPFDLIHARLLLLHLPERRAVLATLAGALRPGGVLLVEEFDRSPLSVLTPADPSERELFARVVDAVLAVLGERGADLDWGRRVHAEMTGLGLCGVHTAVHAESWSHDGGARLHDINSRQLQEPLLAAGLTLDELERFRALVRRPGFEALSYTLVSTSARRPA
ncbi:class I SAM-dependent methyltransferase [Kitasatospora sp. NPDC058170]|uniref:class I SAM-dependent methyltransferase n=1 Tax=Kitasatospora sp. NPDC058170 TaxID=3346364 RepID=UPI0036D90ADC